MFQPSRFERGTPVLRGCLPSSRFEGNMSKFSSMEESEIPKDIWYVAARRFDETKKIVCHRMDMIWAHLRPKLLQVTNIALFLLTIPHSNAAEERVFPIIGKNNTKFQFTLDLATSLNAIMLIKMNHRQSSLPCAFVCLHFDAR